jgi:hypothetical protein
LDDGSGKRTYLAVNKMGNSQLAALNHTPPLDKLPGLLYGDEKKRHAMGSLFVEAAKDKGKSLDDIL